MTMTALREDMSRQKPGHKNISMWYAKWILGWVWLNREEWKAKYFIDTYMGER